METRPCYRTGAAEILELERMAIASKSLAARSNFVIPAQAGIQTAHPLNHCPLDCLSLPRSSRLRGNDDGIGCDRPELERRRLLI